MKFMSISVSPTIGAVTAVLLALSLAACGREEPPIVAKPVPVLPQEPPPMAKPLPEKPAEPPEVLADKALAGKVKSALLAERGLNAHGIDVVARNGVVTLYGTAETAGRRETAARVAAKVSGVKSVENKLAVVAGS
jgi:hypothetical protein